MSAAAFLPPQWSPSSYGFPAGATAAGGPPGTPTSFGRQHSAYTYLPGYYLSPSDYPNTQSMSVFLPQAPALPHPSAFPSLVPMN